MNPMDTDQKLINAADVNLTEEYVTIGQHRIHFVVGGCGSPLLLIHGANIGWGAWYPNLKALAKHFKVYALDLPGSGDSSSLYYRKADLEKDFVEIVEKFISIHDLKNIAVIGHSLGGWIALKLAIKGLPITKIVLESSLGFSDYIPSSYKILAFYPFAKLLSKTAMKPTKKNMEKFLKGVMAKSSILSDELLEYFCTNINKNTDSHPFLLLHRIFGPLKLRKELMLGDNMKKISCPILIIAGDSDPLIPLHRMQRSIKLLPKAKLEIFPSTGHVPSLEKSTEFNEKALQFLQE